jgi:hypothetical protein
MDSKVLIIIISAIGLAIAMIIFQPINTYDIETTHEVECMSDSDCVPETCCHPDYCVPEGHAMDCSDVFCTQMCLGPLDCGAGSCVCVAGKCGVSSNE